ncbi:MAG: hypothetical protein CR955_00870 [Thiotrichales bacterium]|nr:MAG: hypothetical protein CR955_00870 [Thiotrichales bacterium]
MKKWVFVLSFGLMTQACVSVPNESVNNTASNTASTSMLERSKRFSTKNIKKRKEAEFAQKYADLKRMNPAVEVNKALNNNNVYLLAYHLGRSRARVIPGLLEAQSAQSKCRVLELEGMGDVIYGPNHLKYRTALEKYAREFNRKMVRHCR